MDKSMYLDAFHREAVALAAAARLGVNASIPSCPDWTIAQLLGHLGGIYISVTKIVRFGKGEDNVQELEDLELEPAYEAWFRQGKGPDAAPPDVIEWFERSAATIEDVLRAADADTLAWTWYPPDQTAGFWMRRMTHETAIHRWDAQLAHGEPQPFDPEFAADGVDESLSVYQPLDCRPKSTRSGGGESFRFQCTDGEGEWLVRFEGKGMSVSREHGAADVTFAGTASDLFLFAWHRLPLEQLGVVGDDALAREYFQFSPPD